MAANFEASRIAHVQDKYWRDAGYVSNAAHNHDFVHGHLHYDALSDIVGAARIVTFLRNPIERVRSLYFFLRNQSLASLSQNGRSQFFVEQARALPLHEFVAHPDPDIAAIVSNYQIRMLLPASSQSSNEWLTSSLEHLEDYQFVGIADPDLIQQSIAELCRLNGWLAISTAPLVNQSARDISVDRGDMATQLIAERNQHDMALYQLIRRRFTTKPPKPSVRQLINLQALDALPDSYTTGLGGEVTMEQPLRCWGWHDRESDGAKEYWRCAASPVAGLQLRVQSNTPLLLVLDLISVHPRTAMPHITVESRGQRLKSICLHFNDRWHIGVWVPSGVSKINGELTLELRCEVLNEGEYPPPSVADDRFITIVLQRIYIVDKADPPPPVVAAFLRRSASLPHRTNHLVRTWLARRAIKKH